MSFPGPAEAATPVRPKFQHNYFLAIGLFLLTFATTTLMGGLWVAEPIPIFTWQQLILRFVSWEYLAAGMRFSGPLMFILLCHEMGHYLACRKYRVDATLPYFLPAPFGVGTFGAFMKIKDPIPSKPILFDIGVAGPIAGFLAALPFAAYGLFHSTPVLQQAGEGMIALGDPLLFKLITWSMWRMGQGATLMLHPYAFAAWIGMLATMLNLLPFGQLDGGHVLYALLGRHQRRLAMPLFVALLVMGFFWWVWLMWAALILFMGPFHPRLWDEAIPLDRTRKTLGIGALAIFILTFMPIPAR